MQAQPQTRPPPEDQWGPLRQTQPLCSHSHQLSRAQGCLFWHEKKKGSHQFWLQGICLEGVLAAHLALPAGESPAPRPCVLPHSFLPWAVLWPRALTWLCHPSSLLPASPHHLSSLIPEPHSKGLWIQRVPFCQRCERRMKEVASIPLQGWKGVHTEILPA